MPQKLIMVCRLCDRRILVDKRERACFQNARRRLRKMCSSGGCKCDCFFRPHVPGEPEFTSLVPMIKEEGDR